MDEHVRIQGSATGFGFGAFITVPVARGTVLGVYAGRTFEQAQKDFGYVEQYVFEVQKTTVDAFDADGLFETSRGFIPESVARSLPSSEACSLRAVWHGSRKQGKQCSNWTRFMNHATKLFANVKARLGKKSKIEFVASCDIPGGAELFFDYGPVFFAKEPSEPAVHASRPYCALKVKRRVFFVDRALCLAADTETLETSRANKKSSSAHKTAK